MEDWRGTWKTRCGYYVTVFKTFLPAKHYDSVGYLELREARIKIFYRKGNEAFGERGLDLMFVLPKESDHIIGKETQELQSEYEKRKSEIYDER